MWTRKTLYVAAQLTMLCMSAGTAPCSAADKSGAAAPPPKESAPANAPIVGEDADRLLKDMGAYLKAAKEFSFHAEIAYDDLLPSGQKLLLAAEQDIAVRRPDRLYSHYRGEAGRKRFWYDGKTVTLLDEPHNTYATEKVPATIDGTLEHLITQLGFTPPLSDLVYEDPYGVLRRNAAFGFRVGFGHVHGARCHHLAFVEDRVDWQIWIDDGRMRVPRKLVITYKTLPGAPQFIATLSDWDFNTRLPDSLFAPELPAGAARIDFIKAAAKDRPAPQTPARKP